MTDLTDEQLAEIERIHDQVGAQMLYTHNLNTPNWSRCMVAEDLIDAVPVLLRALRDARAENDTLRAQAERHGACAGCNYNDGPDEFCPQHGRTYDDLLGILDKVAAERDSLRAENERLHIDREALTVRLTLARHALIATGYFTDAEVGDDIAPRITELYAALAAPTGQEARSELISCCEHCGCGPSGAGHDDTCSHGCNDPAAAPTGQEAGR